MILHREQLSISLTVPPGTSPSAEPERIASTSTLPPPIHADDNLIIYPFTAFSCVSPPSPRQSALKRRRSQSPVDCSPPRSAPIPSTSTETISTPVEPKLDTSAPNFNPAVLVGEQAKEWRRLVIADMFRGGLKPTTPAYSPHLPTSAPIPSTDNNSASASASAPASTARPRVRYTPTPSYLPVSLPRLHPIPAKTAISYLVVGPALRGEFLGAEAIKRGVRAGPNFAKLVRGERVWVPILPAAVPIDVTMKETEERGKEGKGLNKSERATKEQEKGKAKAMHRAAAKARAALEAAVVDGEGEGHWVDSEDCVGPGEEGSVKSFLLSFYESSP